MISNDPVLIAYTAKHTKPGKPAIWTRIGCAYARGFNQVIGNLEIVPVWVHGHTHTARSYRIGRTTLASEVKIDLLIA